MSQLLQGEGGGGPSRDREPEIGYSASMYKFQNAKASLLIEWGTRDRKAEPTCSLACSKHMITAGQEKQRVVEEAP